MTDPDFVTVGRVDDLAPGEMTYVDVRNTAVCLINLDGTYYAVNDTCTHAEASLSDGTVEGDTLECPLHGGCFEIRTGRPAAMPVVTPIETYRVRVVDGAVQVALTEP